MPRHPAALALAALLLAPQPLPAQKFEGAPWQDLGGIKSGAPPLAPHLARQAPPAAMAPAAPLPAGLQTEPEDPPARVGRIARLSGTVSFRLPGEEEWQPARLNEAVIAGHGLWTEPGARAALEFGRNRLVLDGGTDLRITTLDERSLRATLPRGAVFLRLRGLAEAAEVVEIVTPQAVVASALDGRILIEVGSIGVGDPGEAATRVAVFEGSAVVRLGGEEIPLGPGEAVRLAEGAAPALEPAGAGTPLVAWAATLEARRPPPLAARGMTGAEELGFHGRWETSPDYGDVWYPQGLPADWVPYGDGAWRWQEPWGWTWVDAAPWGFATSHYGRWVRLGPRWGWAPAPVLAAGPRLRPVWAPALVAFLGAARGPGAGPPVGWVPLAPREPWYPWYRASPAYVARANLYQVRDLPAVRQGWAERGRDGPRRETVGEAAVPLPGARLEAFANRRAATLVPAEAMRDSRLIRREAQRLPPEVGAAVLAGPPLRPGPGTAGVTPRMAERLGLRPEERRPEGRRPEAPPGPPPASHAALPEGRRDPGRPGPAAGWDRPPEMRAPAEGFARQQQEMLLRRQQEMQGRQQQDMQQRQQFDQMRRQQEAQQRQQADQMRRQQQEMQQRQQFDQMRRQQEMQHRQQADQMRQRQEMQQRQQFDQMRRQQEAQQRQQSEQMRRQQDMQARQHQEMQQRQQAAQARQHQEMQQRQQAAQAQRQQERGQRQHDRQR
ncbi:DUF6600 domain-containing protein [Siccirubricoccus sp. G192]|uniref:DUF6600 domain-containing protein n=1 Tax=Siccirubricoccus sp. G192 TaxID=2849651 RepID=UPI001C2B8EFC|nr:DUF6600 domain-containing protein [Siccirubricoccus sp. G192]MBV1799590.1 hypothetical protein [Siccirubricoccus sp. G192]